MQGQRGLFPAYVCDGLLSVTAGYKRLYGLATVSLLMLSVLSELDTEANEFK